MPSLNLPTKDPSSVVDAPVLRLIEADTHIQAKLADPHFEHGEKKELKKAIAVVEDNASRFEAKLKLFIGALPEETIADEMLARAQLAKRLLRAA